MNPTDWEKNRDEFLTESEKKSDRERSEVLLGRRSDQEIKTLGREHWGENNMEYFLNGYGYFLTDLTDLPKPTNSRSFQLLCFSSNFD